MAQEGGDWWQPGRRSGWDWTMDSGVGDAKGVKKEREPDVTTQLRAMVVMTMKVMATDVMKVRTVGQVCDQEGEEVSDQNPCDRRFERAPGAWRSTVHVKSLVAMVLMMMTTVMMEMTMIGMVQ